LESESGIQLIHQTGGLVFGPAENMGVDDIDEYAMAMDVQGIPYERLTATQAMARFPQLKLRTDDRVLFQSYSGFVDPRKANAVHTVLGRARGGVILESTLVIGIEPNGDGVRLDTDRGSFTCRRLVLSAGAWTKKLAAQAGVRLPLTVTEEQVTYFATPNLRDFAPDRFPIWIWHGKDCFYGFPVYGEVATKAGQHVGGDVVTVETRSMAPNPRPLNKLTQFLEQRIPGFLGPILYTKPCLYTMPPDQGFILDTFPGYPQISIAIGGGHSFKFASLIGRILCELAVRGSSIYPIEAMRLDRPALTDPNYTPIFQTSAQPQNG
jgi:sarcosine oxidase